jgi:6-phosphogluconolactonase
VAALTVAADADALATAAAEAITQHIEAAAAAQSAVFVTLTGGHTPERLYQLLADASAPWRRRVPWQQLQFLWSDERHVPPNHPDSNFGMAQHALLRHLPLRPAQIHRIVGESPDASASAHAYDAELKTAFESAGRGPIPDVTLLGIGEDAHIASIFPGQWITGPHS